MQSHDQINPRSAPILAAGRREELPYPSDTAARFAPLQNLPGSILLESGAQGVSAGYDLVFFHPRRSLQLPGPINPDALTTALHALASGKSADLCAAGYLSYEFGREHLNIGPGYAAACLLPTAWVGFYDTAIVVSHAEQKAWLVSAPDCSAERVHAQREAWLMEPAASGADAFSLTSRFASNFDRGDYASAFEQIQHYIRAGDCYQVNLAQRFAANCAGSAWDAWMRLRAASPAPYSAFIQTGAGSVLCCSPEQFLEVRAGRVVTRPIKGTRPRGATPEQDQFLAEALQSSIKDQAENLMIVDLLRNDIGKSCAYASISVPELFALHSFSAVHHLVSTITGELEPGFDCVDLLMGCIPGGSITGAPKHRAVEIISELERDAREVYCGSVFWIDRNGNLDSNIAIRSFIHRDRQILGWGGGGIVADSRCEEEYQESILKIRPMLDALEATLK